MPNTLRELHTGGCCPIGPDSPWLWGISLACLLWQSATVPLPNRLTTGTLAGPMLDGAQTVKGWWLKESSEYVCKVHKRTQLCQHVCFRRLVVNFRDFATLPSFFFFVQVHIRIFCQFFVLRHFFDLTREWSHLQMTIHTEKDTKSIKLLFTKQVFNSKETKTTCQWLPKARNMVKIKI